MTTISNKSQFITWLTVSDPNIEKKYFDKKYYRPKGQMVHLKNLEVKDLYIRERDFECTEFKDCTFINCDFSFCIFSSCTLINCQFIKCRFTWSKFLDVDLFICTFKLCIITGLELSDAIMKKTVFQDCSEILDLQIRGSRQRVVAFNNCYLHHLDIEPIGDNDPEIIEFDDCLIIESSFDRVDFSKGKFKDCNLSLCQFSACILSKNSFQGEIQTPGKEYNMIDFRTILNSSPIPNNILDHNFGIHNSDIKDYLVGLTTKIEFQSIFISYSFDDQKFAKSINEELLRRGILTFLWEKDSPGGQQLKSIMSENVKSKDRLLFIASQSSLKSAACQYELTEGRKKQEKTWEDVLFPIHIDNYLFEIKKEKIRPLEVQEEYWNNILELRELNSLPFGDFINAEKRNSDEFESQIIRLIRGLRKNK